jgi:class 3 adenylate cyclase
LKVRRRRGTGVPSRWSLLLAKARRMFGSPDACFPRPDDVWFRDPVPAKLLPARPFVWFIHVALPLLGLYLLIKVPEVDHDLTWQHQPSHFWLVLVTAVISSVLAIKAALEARRHADARLFLVALSFLIAAGFLGLHALGTPTVLIDASNTGFVLATPIGLALASVAAVASAFVPPVLRQPIVRAAPLLLALVLITFAVWAVWSLERWAPLDGQPTVEQHRSDFALFAAPAAMLYCAVAVVYFLQYLKRPSLVLLSVLTAFVLLAEATVATLVGRNWEASWWLWHILMTIAFALVAYGVLVEYSREGSSRALFRAIAFDETLARIRSDYASALTTLVESIETGEEASVERAAAALADRFELSDSQVQLLAQAADALGHERERIRRLGALAAIGSEVSVIRTEAEVVAQATQHLRAGFAPAEVTIDLSPTAKPPARSLAAPLSVKGHPAGLVSMTPGDDASEYDHAMLATLAGQLSVAIENARLYHELDRLFRQYMSPDVATALLADPSQAALGGEEREITVLFADLQGFTAFSEQRDPTEVVQMLNHYFGLAVPIFLAEGGTVAHFIGDALMVLFNAPIRQPNHAHAAARAALAVSKTIATAAAAHPGWPQIRIGINTGPALIGNVGGEDVRSFTAIGDAVNLASRLESLAPPGQVVIGERTHELLDDTVRDEPLGTVAVKGKNQPVEAFRLVAID